MSATCVVLHCFISMYIHYIYIYGWFHYFTCLAYHHYLYGWPLLFLFYIQSYGPTISYKFDCNYN
jgi:hypothetical protein